MPHRKTKDGSGRDHTDHAARPIFPPFGSPDDPSGPDDLSDPDKGGRGAAGDHDPSPDSHGGGDWQPPPEFDPKASSAPDAIGEEFSTPKGISDQVRDFVVDTLKDHARFLARRMPALLQLFFGSFGRLALKTIGKALHATVQIVEGFDDVFGIAKEYSEGEGSRRPRMQIWQSIGIRGLKFLGTLAGAAVAASVAEVIIIPIAYMIAPGVFGLIGGWIVAAVAGTILSALGGVFGLRVAALAYLASEGAGSLVYPQGKLGQATTDSKAKDGAKKPKVPQLRADSPAPRTIDKNRKKPPAPALPWLIFPRFGPGGHGSGGLGGQGGGGHPVFPSPPPMPIGGVSLRISQSDRSYVAARGTDATRLAATREHVLSQVQRQVGTGTVADERHPTGQDYFCVSLAALAEAARRGAWAIRADAPLATCFGLNYVSGYVIDPANHDVVLFGWHERSRPVIEFDDLCVCIQNVWHPDRMRYVDGQYPHPFCSLDPRPGAMPAASAAMRGIKIEELLDSNAKARAINALAGAVGPQEIEIGGISRDVRLAHVMVDADYHMKKVSQGHIRVGGVSSTSRLRFKRDRGSRRHMALFQNVLHAEGESDSANMSRFWFHVDHKQPFYQESQDIVEIHKCSLIVLTERQISAADGTLKDAGDHDPGAQAFADCLSQQLRSGATRVPEYEDLENLLRLQAVLKAFQFRSEGAVSGLQLSPFLNYQPRRIEMPLALPGLANIELVRDGQGVHGSFVCGGVSMDISLTPAQFQTSRGDKLNQVRAQILASRPGRSVASWRLRKDPPGHA